MKMTIAFVLGLLISTAARAQVSVLETQSHARSPWSYGFFSLASTELDQQDQGGGSLSTYNYLTVANRLDWGHRLALRLPFTYQTAGYDQFNGRADQSQQMGLQDIFVSLTAYHLALLPWDVGVYWEGRVYAPTSKFSRDTKMITRLRNDFILTKYLATNVILEYTNKFNYYYQSRTAYKNHFTDDSGFDVDTVSLTKEFYLDHWIEAWYMFRPKFGLGLELGSEETWWNHSDVYGKSHTPQHLWKIGPSVKFALSDRANFIFSLENVVNNGTDAANFARFRTQDTRAVLLSFISL